MKFEKLDLDYFKKNAIEREVLKIRGGEEVTTAIVTGCSDGTTKGDGSEPDCLECYDIE